MNYPRVSFLILNWNGWRNTIECLESLYQIAYPNFDVVVIDNDSQDDSIQKIKEWAEGKIPVESKFFRYNPDGKPVRFIEYERQEAEAGGGKEKEISSLPSSRKLIILKNEQNFGSTKGWNIGIRYAIKALNSEWFICMDNDVAFAPDFLDELVKVSQKEPDAGIMSSMIYYYDEPDKIWPAGGHINYWKGPISIKGVKEAYLIQSSDPIELDFVFGPCELISREVFTTIGLLDEDFFFGGEELDICIRAKKQGFKIFLVPKSKIWHKFTGNISDEKRLANYHHNTLPGLFVLMEKHWRGPRLVIATLYFIFSRLALLLLFPIRTRRWSVLKDYPAGVLDYLRWRIRPKP